MDVSRTRVGHCYCDPSVRSDIVLFNVQVLRGLAATAVVWVHASVLVPTGSMPLAFGQFGYGGVNLFFVISGFIMARSTQVKNDTPYIFIKKRLARLCPLYYFVTLIVFALSALFPSIFGSTSPDFYQLIKSLLFVPFEKSDGRMYPIYFVGWTLNYEMMFYVIFSVSLLLSKSFRIYVVSAILFSLAFLGFWIETPNVYGPLAFYYTRQIIVDFAFGMLIAQYWASAEGERIGPSLAMVVVGLSWLVLGGSFVAFGKGAVLPPTDTVLRFGIPSALIVAGAVGLERGGWRIGTELMRRSGDASYSIYLFHYYFVAVIIAAAGGFAFGSAQRTLLACVTVVAAVALGGAAYKLVERPLAGDWSAYGRVWSYWRRARITP